MRYEVDKADYSKVTIIGDSWEESVNRVLIAVKALLGKCGT